MKTTGAISQSSKYLINGMLKHVDFSKDLRILELGAGQGNITEIILKKMSDKSKLHAYEINPVFYNELLQIDDNRLEVCIESAANLTNKLSIGSIDVVISALPLTLFNKLLKKEIFESIKTVMNDDAVFIQYQYSLSDYKLIHKNFNKVNLSLSMLNIPPAIVYYCQNKI